MENDLSLEAKVLAFYMKLKSEWKGPVHKMVMESVLKEYEEYFEIKIKDNGQITKGA